MRSPTITSTIRQLINEGIKVSTVLDVGTAKQTWPLQEVFPDKKHILFEPCVEFKTACEKDYEKHEIDYELYNIALSDFNDLNGQLFYNVHSDSHRADGYLEADIGVNYIWAGVVPRGEEDYHGNNHPKRDMEIATLDTFLVDKNYDKPYYLKIDTDGGEMGVIRGAQNTLKYCSMIQIESCLYKDLEHTAWGNINWLESIGFQLWDVVDLHYTDNRLWQVDLVFIPTQEFKRIGEQKKKIDRKNKRYTFVRDDGEIVDFKP